MKKTAFILVLLGLAACGGGRKANLTMTTDTIFIRQDSDVVRMLYPVARDGAVADSINRHVIRTLSANLPEPERTDPNMTLRQAIDATLARKKMDSLVSYPLEMYSEGRVNRRDGIISILLGEYLYMGGAHGLHTSTFLNFDEETGRLLTLNDLVSDTVKLAALNREAFKVFWGTKGAEVSPESLFVTMDRLPLPKNIGFDERGVVMIYNPYEIAPYVFGESRYTIPYAQVKPLLRNILK